MELKNETATLEAAANLDGKALARICTYLQKYARKHGKQHAEIEARRLLICSIFFADNNQIDTLKMLFIEMVAQA